MATWRRWEEDPAAVRKDTQSKCQAVLDREAGRRKWRAEWLRESDAGQPLHEVEPFTAFDLRVMVYVKDNKAWAAKAAERCHAVASEIERGILPFDRPGCYFDELLMGAALHQAEEQLDDMPELYDDIAADHRADA